MPQCDKKSIISFSEKASVVSACLLIFFLPISIALVEIFSAILIVFFLVRKYIDVSSTESEQTHSPKTVLMPWRFLRALILPAHPLRFSIILLMAVFFLSVIFSRDVHSSFIAYIGKFLQGIGLMLSVYEGLRKKEHLLWFTLAFVGSGILVSLSGITQYLFSIEFLRGNNGIVNGRVNSTFRHPNDFGAYLIVLLGFTMALFRFIPKGKELISKIILVGLLAFELLVLMLTYSRCAWIAVLAMAIFVAVINRKFITFLIPIVLIMSLFFIPFLKSTRGLNLLTDHRFMTQETVPDEKLRPYATVITKYKNDNIVHSSLIFISRFGGSGRAEYWDRAWQVFATSPLVGVGMNMYAVESDKVPGYWGRGYAHNCYLQIMAETGIVGIVAFLFFIISLFIYTLRSLFKFKDEQLKIMLSAVFGAWVAFLCQSFLDTTFYSVQLGNLLWILCGLMLAIVNVEAKLTNQKSSL